VIKIYFSAGKGIGMGVLLGAFGLLLELYGSDVVMFCHFPANIIFIDGEISETLPFP
jgi:hypothetical protein